MKLDVEENEIVNYEIENLQNGSKFEVRVKYQNDNGMGIYPSVLAGVPHKKASIPLSRLSGLSNDLIYISSFVQELNGLDFKKLICKVFDGDELKETREDS